MLNCYFCNLKEENSIIVQHICSVLWLEGGREGGREGKRERGRETKLTETSTTVKDTTRHVVRGVKPDVPIIRYSDNFCACADEYSCP